MKIGRALYSQNRRDFLKAAVAGAAGVALGGCTGTKVGANERLLPPRMMWCYMAQLGMKMWERRIHYTDLKVDDSMWADLTARAAEAGVNVFVFDLGEGMVVPSHPELAVHGSWEPERMKDEIARLAKMGMMAVPKLNFSSSHDQWLGKWRKYLSTPEYFAVCREVIRDVAEVFDRSPLFHLGYDEETYFIQDVNKFEYKRLRSGNLWWNDFLWFVREVESYGSEPSEWFEEYGLLLCLWFDEVCYGKYIAEYSEDECILHDADEESGTFVDGSESCPVEELCEQ